MVADTTRDAVWRQLFNVMRVVRYYDALANKYKRNHLILRFLLLAAAASGVVALLDLLPPASRAPAGLMANGLVTLLVAWEYVSDYAKKAAVLHAVSVQCGKLQIEWRMLWLSVDAPDTQDAEVRSEIRRLMALGEEITAWPGSADIREDRKLNEKCEEAAHRAMSNEYAV